MRDGSPWLGRRKQLVPRDEEGRSSLGRLLGQLDRAGCGDVVVTVDAASADEFGPVAGDRLRVLDPAHLWDGGLNVVASRPVWATGDRTTILFGDVFYSDEALAAIVACEEPGVWWFRRTARSELTGHRWDEPFGLSFGPGEHDRLFSTAEALSARWRPGQRALHSWQLHAALTGHPQLPGSIRSLPNMTVIDDWTDDIDSPAEAVGWLGRYHAGKIRAVVGIPWMGGDAVRRRAFEWCRSWWAGHGFEVVVSELEPDGDGLVNLAAARNRAAAMVDNWDVFVFADADTVGAAENVWAAAYLAVQFGQVVLPFEGHRRLPAYGSERVMRSGRLPTRSTAPRVTSAVGGIVVVPRIVWSGVRFDERFRGWGSEDRAFHAATSVLYGEHDRLPGDSFHLWHPPAPDAGNRVLEHRRANMELMARYRDATGVTSSQAWRPRWERNGYVPGPVSAAELCGLLTEPGGPMEAV